MLSRSKKGKRRRQFLLWTVLLVLLLTYACRLALLTLSQPSANELRPAQKGVSDLITLPRSSWPKAPISTSPETKTLNGANDEIEEEEFRFDDEEGIDNGCWEWSKAEQDTFCTPAYCAHVATTTLYCSCCGVAQPAILRPLLITGTPRSGTVYLSTLLSSLGLTMGLDTSFATHHGGMVSWAHIYPDAGSTDLHFTMHRIKPPYFRHVIQLVRDPLASLTSIAFTEPLLHDEGYLRFLQRHGVVSQNATIVTRDAAGTNETETAESDTTSAAATKILVQRALQFYTSWHQAIADLHVPLLRLEDLDVEMLQTIFRYTTVKNVPTPERIATALQQRNRRRLNNSSQGSRFFYARSYRRLVRRSASHLEQRRRRRRKRHRPGEVRSNQREHRTSLQWHELCQVDEDLTVEFLEISQSFGYYDDVDGVCA